MKKKQLVQGAAVVGAGIALLSSIKSRAKNSQNATANTAFVATSSPNNPSIEVTDYIVTPRPTGDFTEVLKEYIEKARNQNKTLFVKKYDNTYTISDQIPITCNIISDGAKILLTAYDKPVFTITNQRNLSIKGLYIDANARTKTALTYGNHVGIKVTGSKMIDISDVFVERYWGAAISLTDCEDCTVDNAYCINSISTQELWPSSTEHGDADITVNSVTKGQRNTVKNSKCLSHKSSLGIWVNSMGMDTLTRIDKNICAGLLPSLEPCPAGDLKKRHGIQLGYNASLGNTFNEATNNYCFNTGITGISCASRGAGQKVNISYNYCEKNGLGGVDGTVLRGGIHFQWYGHGSTCNHNKIIDFQTESDESGGLGFTVGDSAVEIGSLICDGNYIEGSKSHGIYLGYSVHNVKFINTRVKNSQRSDVWFFDMTTRTHSIEFVNFYAERSNDSYPCFRIQNAIDLKGFSIIGGKIKGFSNSFSENNTGVFILHCNIAGMQPIMIKDLIIEGFGTGIGVYSPFNADVRDKLIIKDVSFRNLLYGVGARQADTNGILPVFSCDFTNVTAKTNGWGYANAARVAAPSYSLTT